MASFETTGKLIAKFDEQQVSATYRKREFVIEIPDGNYPQQVKFQLSQDKCDLIDNYKEGDELAVSFNLRGKPYTKNGVTSYFSSLESWRISYANGGIENRSRPTAAASSQTFDDPESDLPF